MALTHKLQRRASRTKQALSREARITQFRSNVSYVEPGSPTSARASLVFDDESTPMSSNLQPDSERAGWLDAVWSMVGQMSIQSEPESFQSAGSIQSNMNELLQGPTASEPFTANDNANDDDDDADDDVDYTRLAWETRRARRCATPRLSGDADAIGELSPVRSRLWQRRLQGGTAGPRLLQLESR